MTKDEALMIIIESIKVMCLGVLGCIAITTAFALILAWGKLTCKFLDYVWALV